jgi:CubicO group peptidase (beta-lactamase class C family)
MYILMGAGGVQATADDMLRYDAALRAGAVLPFDLQQRMLDSAFQQPEPERPRVGYGWFIRQAHGRQLLSHSGGTNGYSCEFARVPSEGICIVILSNFGFAKCTDLRNKILGILYPGEFDR